MKKNIGDKGQIGPSSLEDIFPMVIAFIMLFTLIAALYLIIAGQLEQRSSEAAQNIAHQTALLIKTKSPLIYGGEQGLLDAGTFGSFSYERLNASYGVTGYFFSAEIKDLVSGRGWIYAPHETGQNTFSLSSPVAIRYSEDTIHEGLLIVRVWRR